MKRNRIAIEGIRLGDKTLDRSLESGIVGWVTRLVIGKELIDHADHTLALAQKHAADEHKRRAGLMARGVGARGVVIEVVDTGMMISHNPVIRLTLRVVPTVGKPFDIVTEQQVTRRAIPKIGDTISVKFDMTDRHNMMVI